MSRAAGKSGLPVPVTVDSCAHIGEQHRGRVVVAGSYGGYFNAYNASRHFVRGLIMSDAGVGIGGAGIAALPDLDRIGLAAATADAATCRIGDGADMLARGTTSHVNPTAAAIGCRPGQSLRACAALMETAAIATERLPPPPEVGRFMVEEGRCQIVCADSLIMLRPEDRGRIMVTGSHAALPHGMPDHLVAADVAAIFLSDGGIGLEDAGIARLTLLDARAIPAAAVSVWSAAIGDSRALLATGVLSRVNRTAAALGMCSGQTVRQAVQFVAVNRRR